MRIFIAALFLCLFASSANARLAPQSDFDRHDPRGFVPQQFTEIRHAAIKRVRHHKKERRIKDRPGIPNNHAKIESGLTTIGKDDNGDNITVASSVADRFQAFIADVRARGFKGRIHCFATRGHVRNSLHYSGRACDFAQRGWGKTVAVMYRVADLAAKHGLRDGCTFRDCGHIDTGFRYARHARTRYAAAR